MSSAARKIGPWEVVKQLGQGSFGDVFVAVHEDTKVKAAVKVIDTSKWDDKSAKRRTKLLKREIRFSRLLHHPNVIKMIDTMVDGSKVILVLEYVPGGDMEGYIENKPDGRLTETKSRALFRQIVSGVDYLHKNSIIHRDIKPANVMLDDTHSIPKLIDFGFTTAYDNEKAMYSFLGSPHYAAPELLQGIKYDGPKVDIWSLGVTLFTMLTGTLPFQAQTMEALLNLIVNAQFEIPAYVPAGVADLMKKMMVVDPHTRLSMEEVRQHPWVNDGYTEPPVDLAITRDAPIAQVDGPVFAALKDFEFNDEQQNREALMDGKPSKIKNVYCLLLEARDRAAQEHYIAQMKAKEREQKKDTSSGDPAEPKRKDSSFFKNLFSKKKNSTGSENQKK